MEVSVSEFGAEYGIELISCFICRKISFVDAHPSWAKHLEAHLTAGIHLITFRARSPTSDANDVCRAAITVKGFTFLCNTLDFKLRH